MSPMKNPVVIHDVFVDIDFRLIMLTIYVLACCSKDCSVEENVLRCLGKTHRPGSRLQNIRTDMDEIFGALIHSNQV